MSSACMVADVTGLSVAALAAIEGPQQCVDTMLVEFAKRRQFVRERIASIGYTEAQAKEKFGEIETF